MIAPPISLTRASSELVVPELSHSDIASYWHIINSHLTRYSQECVMGMVHAWVGQKVTPLTSY